MNDKTKVRLIRLNYMMAGIVALLGGIAFGMMMNPPRGPEPEPVVTPVASPAEVIPVQKVAAQEAPAKAPVFDEGQPQDLILQDWRFDCSLGLDGMKGCSAFQRILWEDGKSQALMAVVLMAERDGKPVPRLRLITPLGTFLPTGLSVKLQGEEPFEIPFQFCAADGCFVNLDLAPDVVEAMKKGGAMSVEYLAGDKKLATVDVSLNGFEAALERVAE